MISKEVAQAIDELGALRFSKNDIMRQEKLLMSILKDKLKGTGTFFGGAYSVSVTEKVVTPILPDKAFKTLGTKKFLEVVSIIKKKVERFLSLDEIDKISGAPETTRVFSTNLIAKGQ